MYLEHFGFHERPFDITVASRFFFASPMHEEAHAALLYGVRERRGFILLTGEAGTGKTTVLRRLRETLEDPIHVACFDNTTLTFDELLDVMCQLFDLPVKAGRRLEKIQALNAFLLDCHRARGTGVLIIDEAQNLADDVLENLRLLSNFEAESEKLLQIVLVGQPELEKKLERPELRQLKQRVVVRCQLDRLKAQHIGPFIHHRLQVAGCNRQDIFAPDAIRRIAVYSGRIPRLVNTICDNALLTAYSQLLQTVSAEIIEEVAQELRLVKAPSPLREPAQEQAKAAPKVIVLAQADNEEPPQEHIDDAQRLSFDPPVRSWLRPALVIIGVALLGGLALRFENVLTLSTIVRDALARIVTADLTASSPETQQSNPKPEPQNEKSAAAVLVEPPPAPPPQPKVPAEQKEARPEQAASEAVAPSLASVPLEERKGQRVTIAPGETISGIAAKLYGSQSILALDLVKEMNPHLEDLNQIAIGEQVWFPVLNRETLLRPGADGSYQLIIGTFSSEGDAVRAVNAARRKGYTAMISQQQVSRAFPLYRVTLEGLKDLATVDRAWRFINQDRKKRREDALVETHSSEGLENTLSVHSP
jgi:type II secretory pathway predicted ATPase ExeA